MLVRDGVRTGDKCLGLGKSTLDQIVPLQLLKEVERRRPLLVEPPRRVHARLNENLASHLFESASRQRDAGRVKPKEKGVNDLRQILANAHRKRRRPELLCQAMEPVEGTPRSADCLRAELQVNGMLQNRRRIRPVRLERSVERPAASVPTKAGNSVSRSSLRLASETSTRRRVRAL